MKNLLLLLTIILSITVNAKAIKNNSLVFDEKIYGEKQTENSIYRFDDVSGLNKIKIMNIGTEALAARLQLIEKAEKHIELEYFIFNPDTAGRLMLQALAKKAKSGVKVRLLVDSSSTVLKLDGYYAQVLKNKNIQLKYYNPTNILQLSSMNFRNHRKLLSIDNKEAITGGRNIADEYFDLSEEFNFLDRDVMIKGPIVKVMNKTFENFWTSNLTKLPELPYKINSQIMPGNKEKSEEYAHMHTRYINYMKKINFANSVFTPNNKDIKALNFINSYSMNLVNNNKLLTCPKLSFATDKEGGSFKERTKSKKYHKEYRLLRKEISEWIQKVDSEIILDSPYFLNNKRSKAVLVDLLDKNKEVIISTNSLGSTDNILVSTVFNSSVPTYTKRDNFNAYVVKGIFTEESQVLNEKIRNASWGTHSKTIVFNDKSFMIGTYNIDNRSSFYNTEMAIFCEGNETLTADVKDNIEHRMNYSLHLNKKGLPDDGTPLLQRASTSKKLLYYFLKVPALAVQFLF